MSSKIFKFIHFFLIFFLRPVNLQEKPAGRFDLPAGWNPFPGFFFSDSWSAAAYAGHAVIFPTKYCRMMRASVTL